MIRLKSLVIFHISNFYWAIENMQCPLNKNTTFINKGISCAIAVVIDQRYVTANFSWTCALVLLKWNDGRVCHCHMSVCAWGFTQASRLNFPTLLSTMVPSYIFELGSNLAKPAFVVLCSSQMAQHTLRTSKSVSVVSPSFLCSKWSKAI